MQYIARYSYYYNSKANNFLVVVIHVLHIQFCSVVPEIVLSLFLFRLIVGMGVVVLVS